MPIQSLALVVLAALKAGFVVAQSSAQVPSTASQTDLRTPAFDLENIAGGRTKLTEIPGKILVLDFWATWAIPSDREIPNLIRLHELFSGKGVQFAAIAEPSENYIEGIRTKVRDFGIKYPVLVGNDTVREAFSVLGFPTTYILTRGGQDWKIYKTYLGSSPGRTERIQKDIETLLSEQK